MTTARVPTRREIYQLRISLKYEPTIWRSVQVAGNTSLGYLHYIIQAAMGWENYHMHQFMWRGHPFGEKNPNLEFEDEDKVGVSDLIPRVRQKLDYEYDFGDSWMHEIRVEKVLPRENGQLYPVCVGGARHCPPEDCGGIGGYQWLLDVISQPDHPEHKNMMEWVGGRFDPEEFNIDDVNERLDPLRPKLRIASKRNPAKKAKTKR